MCDLVAGVNVVERVTSVLLLWFNDSGLIELWLGRKRLLRGESHLYIEGDFLWCSVTRVAGAGTSVVPRLFLPGAVRLLPIQACG